MKSGSTFAVIAGLTACVLLAGCFPGDDGDTHWASREQIVQAASRCGIQGFKPTQVEAAWAAYVPGENPDKGPQGDCIYADLKRQGLTATR